jgi:vacuolar-type H+-ATPase subunit E/Vma4
MKTIINCTTGEVTKRELNAEELAQQAKDVKQVQAEKAEQQAEAQAKAQAKAELLERLGITADEAKLLLA